MSSYVLDASAVLAVTKNEPGASQVAAAIIAGAAISTVNLAEVVSWYANHGFPIEASRHELSELGLEVVPLDEATAYAAGMLLPQTKHLGLSLGDRVCLMLARSRGVPALTGDQKWRRLQVGVSIEMIR